jgi:hypothetical protein
MAEARRKHDGHLTAWTCHVLANCHRDPKRKRSPFTVAQFDPFTGTTRNPRPTGIRLTRQNVAAIGLALAQRQ